VVPDERNKELGEPIVYNEYYNEVVCEHFESNESALENDFRRYTGDIQHGYTRTPMAHNAAASATADLARVSVCSECFIRSPFLLTPLIKSKLLRLASQLEMEQRRHVRGPHHLSLSLVYGLLIMVGTCSPQDAIRRMMLERQMAVPYLVFKVTRHRVVQDALEQANQYVTHAPEDLRKQLKVKFIGEEGVDEGGVQKEFFQLIIRDLFDPKYGIVRGARALPARRVQCAYVLVP